jgi:hypothetical protein
MKDSAQMEAVERKLAEPLADARGDGIGFVGPDLSIELLLASGRPFGHLPWRVDGHTPYADQWLESSFPFWARSILEQWHEGLFAGLDAVVFSRGDDASQRLYYYVAELQRRGKLSGPRPVLFDIALVPREASLLHTEAAIVELMDTLDINTSAVPAACERANRLRRRFAAIEQARTVAGPRYERLARAAVWSDPTLWIDEIRLPEVSDRAPRLLLAGSVPPDERLHLAVESAGACVIAETHPLALGRLGPEFALNGEPPERSLARQLRAAAIGPRAFLDRAARIVDRARAVRAEAVVIWLTREDEALAWSAPAMQQALAAAGLPTLLLPAARWQADDGALESLAAFCREWSDAPA